MKNMKKFYLLNGVVKVKLWGGGNGWGRFEKRVDEKEFRELKKINFLDDYFNFGVESVDWVEVRIIPIIEGYDENGDYIRKYLHSQEWYEEGGQLTKKEKEELEKIYFDLEIVKLN
jgi:hypothetical protein